MESHRSVGRFRQRNDRLGRSRGWQLFQHRREILRAAWFAYTHANSNCNRDRYTSPQHSTYSNAAAAPDPSTETIGVGRLGFFEIALALVRLNHVAGGIVNAARRSTKQWQYEQISRNWRGSREVQSVPEIGTTEKVLTVKCDDPGKMTGAAVVPIN